MAGIKADWAHTKAASMLRDSEGFTTPIYPRDVSRLADALREAEANGYKRGKNASEKDKSDIVPGYIY